MNKHKIFIKECYEGKHGSICQEWKDTILKHYPELGWENVKPGDWAWVERSPFHKPEKDALIQLHDDYYGLCFGFTHGGNWTYTYSFHRNNTKGYKVRKATPKEIESRLIEEAKKRGFKSGICHTITNGDSVIDLTKSKSDRLEYDRYSDKLLLNNWCIYEKGKWAGIVETITKEEAEKQLGKKIV